MTRQQAQNRNWAKARILGSYVRPTLLTKEETEIIDKIEELKKKLIENWDENSYILSGKPIPKFKCHFCGKRTNVDRKIVSLFPRGSNQSIQVCKKHREEHKDYYGEQ